MHQSLPIHINHTCMSAPHPATACFPCCLQAPLAVTPRAASQPQLDTPQQQQQQQQQQQWSSSSRAPQSLDYSCDCVCHVLCGPCDVQVCNREQQGPFLSCATVLQGNFKTPQITDVCPSATGQLVNAWHDALLCSDSS
jgi:hypothetical protein